MTAFGRSSWGALTWRPDTAVLLKTPLLVAIIFVSASINILIGSASAKWAILAPVFVPMLMQLGVSPDLTQAAYRIGDTVTNLISPLNPYVVLTLVFLALAVQGLGYSQTFRMLAIARIYFDNIPNLQSSWVTMGPKIGQLALFFGANDMGSVMMEENVVSAAGTTYKLESREICRLIRDAGWIPSQRDQYYNILKRHDGADSPDLRPPEHPRLRNVEKIDKTFIGRAPGMEPIFASLHNGQSDDADKSVKVQLPILGS